ncbi:PepSY domain-containing protein [Poseidonibacter lekithochrous]|nr:PepSY domain-containing protein [Poseidonibacter lekithochrous]
MLSNFFNDLHIRRNIPKIGQLLMGIASILIIFLTISGVILYLNKHKKTIQSLILNGIEIYLYFYYPILLFFH